MSSAAPQVALYLCSMIWLGIQDLPECLQMVTQDTRLKSRASALQHCIIRRMRLLLTAREVDQERIPPLAISRPSMQACFDEDCEFRTQFGLITQVSQPYPWLLIISCTMHAAQPSTVLQHLWQGIRHCSISRACAHTRL